MKKVIIYVKPNNGFASATKVNEIDMRVYADTLSGVIVLNVDVNLSEENNPKGSHPGSLFSCTT